MYYEDLLRDNLLAEDPFPLKLEDLEDPPNFSQPEEYEFFSSKFWEKDSCGLENKPTAKDSTVKSPILFKFPPGNSGGSQSEPTPEIRGDKQHEMKESDNKGNFLLIDHSCFIALFAHEVLSQPFLTCSWFRDRRREEAEVE